MEKFKCLGRNLLGEILFKIYEGKCASGNWGKKVLKRRKIFFYGIKRLKRKGKYRSTEYLRIFPLVFDIVQSAGKKRRRRSDSDGESGNRTCAVCGAPAGRHSYYGGQVRLTDIYSNAKELPPERRKITIK